MHHNQRRNDFTGLGAASGAVPGTGMGTMTVGNNCAAVGRRKSVNYQAQLTLKSNGDESIIATAGRFSPHPNEICLAQSSKLTIPLTKFDDTLINGSLPPPSPAPHSDCMPTSHSQSQSSFHSKIGHCNSNAANPMQQLNLNHFQHHSHHASQCYPLSLSNSTSSLCTNNSIISMQPDNSANIHHKQVDKYGIQQHSTTPRAMSPNSKYRFRDSSQKLKLMETINLSTVATAASSTPIQTPAPPPASVSTSTSASATASSCGRYFITPKQVMQCDAYGGYLGSTVHTPVKRYVPTPPPASDVYSDLAATPPLPSLPSQYVNLPYSYRAKCCHSEYHQNETSQTQASYSKSAQIYNMALGSSLSATSCPCPSSSPVSSTSFPIPAATANTCSPIVGSNTKSVGTCSKFRSTATDSRSTIRSNSDESEGVLALQSVIAQNDSQRQGLSQSQEQDTAGTCLHCNTARRTTGVHQTTQTTGPISPVPVGLPVPLDLGKLKQHEHEMLLATQGNAIALEANSSDIYATPHSQQQLKISENFQRQMQQPQETYPASQIATAHHLQQLQHSQQQSVPIQQQQQQQQLQQLIHRHSCKKRIIIYLRREISRFFGVEASTEAADFALWYGRHRRLAIRRFGPLNSNTELEYNMDNGPDGPTIEANVNSNSTNSYCASDRPDILPVQDSQHVDLSVGPCRWRKCYASKDFNSNEFVERKASVAHMLMTGVSYLINVFHLPSKNVGHDININLRRHRQWSRSFAPIHVHDRELDMDTVGDCNIGIADSLAALLEEEVFFDNPCENAKSPVNEENTDLIQVNKQGGVGVGVGVEGSVGVYMAERHHNGWRTSALNGNGNVNDLHLIPDPQGNHMSLGARNISSNHVPSVLRANLTSPSATNRGNRITAQLLDGVLENSRRPQRQHIKYFSINDLDDRCDHRPFFTYWINTVHIVVLFLSIVCYGIAPIGFGTEQKTGQVLVTSLSLQTVQHIEQRNLWIGPRNNDLVHMGAKFAACMRRDVKVMEVVTKTRRQERETACCIRNDDSGCVQSSQADCSIRGLYPTKSISTWKKWSPGESGPGGRISGSVCGLDPKFCDAPASIAPYEWPDDITKWPICRKTNSFSQRYRYKDHTAEHMICEVIGHPCCTGVYGECRITTREYCDFVNGYFHEEASLCSQISCLNNVCGMFPFIAVEIPDQIYRLLTSLCMHAGILHLAITLIFQYLFLADLERLIGTLRTAVVYIMSGLAGNLTSAVLVPHRPEVGPAASLCGVLSSLVALLIWMHWKHLHKPYIALFKILLLTTVLFGIGTLPYQLNFAGLLAGVACGTFLTISLVPFTSFTKYGRRKKINLIWTCILFHLFVYATLITTFYIYPSEFNTFSFVDDIFGSNNGNKYISPTNSNIGLHYGEHISTETETQRQKNVDLWQDGLYTRSFRYDSNYSDRIYNNIESNLLSDTNLFSHKTPNSIPTSSGRNKNSSRIMEEASQPNTNTKNIENTNDTNFKGL
ncbi:inactive rhomboid protein 1 isoform X2 [Drosophila hydei]|uniref:Inactive rhomboid protein 1 isoform X2 n=1 Tax=Drosophila hydei TaxID=7224 RepID=A0A6J1LMH5_DROHY|nr:inactive rhomboid protein 1 isoform X2 [Drosophila hydei]